MHNLKDNKKCIIRIYIYVIRFIVINDFIEINLNEILN
jgi:hypothetical protein